MTPEERSARINAIQTVDDLWNNREVLREDISEKVTAGIKSLSDSVKNWQKELVGDENADILNMSDDELVKKIIENRRKNR